MEIKAVCDGLTGTTMGQLEKGQDMSAVYTWKVAEWLHLALTYKGLTGHVQSPGSWNRVYSKRDGKPLGYEYFLPLPAGKGKKASGDHCLLDFAFDVWANKQEQA